jgi:hypothetical protein
MKYFQSIHVAALFSNLKNVKSIFYLAVRIASFYYVLCIFEISCIFMKVRWVITETELVACNLFHVTSTRLHGATTQKIAIFILATIRTSNPI